MLIHVHKRVCTIIYKYIYVALTKSCATIFALETIKYLFRNIVIKHQMPVDRLIIIIINKLKRQSYALVWCVYSVWISGWSHVSKRHTWTSVPRRDHALTSCAVAATASSRSACRKRRTHARPRPAALAGWWRRCAPCRSERWSLIGRGTSRDKSGSGCPASQSETREDALLVHWFHILGYGSK